MNCKYDKYVPNGEVQRGKIANAIARRELTEDDVYALVELPEVKQAFIDDTYRNQIGKHGWNKDYLDVVSSDSSAKSFNLEYLLYLNKVAAAIHRKRRICKVIWGCIIILVVVLLAIYYYRD